MLQKMDRKGLGLGSDTGSVMHLFWGSDPARGYRLSTDPIAYRDYEKKSVNKILL